ncbi:Nicotinate phosphoribosyltransferase 2 [Aedoeadaptatus ivorii]|uniref:Nicotinate phosphoribosyltransferase n=1 Tax=Aedoeadaptatus ivorii TaxID=54006 RepID=A0A3S5AIJ1_9FIRM|nr:nicotinate phosphoribosyltransferase [Peptoniphilus ivorii]VEJ34875.1 Nicotinate phosphoribosyltransferase 2 [Peptoniphilus ivorii]
MNFTEKNNYTLLADFYEFTMGNGYLENGMSDQIVHFDMFFRSAPDEASYAIVSGLEPMIEYIEALKFNDEDIAFLRSKGIFSEDFLEYLSNFEFSCDVRAVPEGTVVFPQEPLVTVRGPVIQAQLIETMVLLTINHQTMIATKANRICTAADGRPVTEFGSRRAQGYSGANLGARAAYIGGCNGTANTLADIQYGVPALGTMAHSWVQMFDEEIDAFRAYAKVYPDNCFLLIDTYDVLKQGLPNAIQVFRELREAGHEGKGVRIDSGDIAYLSKKIRKILDASGFEDVKIMASSSLDEYVIEDLLKQDACIDSFGVGERLITSKSHPVFGGVYKLVALEDGDTIIPTIKISENVTKITTPGVKEIWRFYDRDHGKALADVITQKGETIPEDEYEIFHPLFTWKRKTLKNYEVRPLLEDIYVGGKLVYESPDLDAIRDKVQKELGTLWDEIKRLNNPHEYIVDLSPALWKVKDDLLEKHGANK